VAASTAAAVGLEKGIGRWSRRERADARNPCLLRRRAARRDEESSETSHVPTGLSKPTASAQENERAWSAPMS